MNKVISPLLIATIILLILKVIGIKIGWLWVLAPIWIPLGIVLSFGLFAAGMMIAIAIVLIAIALIVPDVNYYEN